MPEFRWSKNVAALLCLALLGALAISTPGCGGKQSLEDRAFGRITFKGEPVPVGIIQFSPDVSQGGSGAVGFAEIRDGIYDTDLSGGGITGGAYIVTIDTYTLKNIDPDLKPNGDALVVGYKQKLTINSGQTSAIDFELAK